MKKSRVDKLIALFDGIEKQELIEFSRRLAPLHIYAAFHIPLEYVEGHEPMGRLLKK